MIWLIAFIATVPLANWMVHSVGTVCIPDGPCLIPVAPGIMAPSGVLVIGLAFILRDLVQRQYGVWVAGGCVLVGAVLSAVVATPALAVASGVAFLVSEMADLGVYTAMRERFLRAVVVSGAVGLVIDSLLFLWLAFGSLDHLDGQIVGKALMLGLGASMLWLWRRRAVTA